jgi:CRP-like cAMP-binding protein
VTGPGGVVGELAVLGGWRRTADVEAVTDIEAIVFDVRSFQKALHVSDRLRRHVEQAVIDHSVSS